MGRVLKQKPLNEAGFVKPGELIELRNHHVLTLHDRRVLNELVQQAWPEITEDIDHRVQMWRLRGPKHKGGERVRESVQRLLQTMVEMKTTDSAGNPATMMTTLLASVVTTDDENKANGEVVFTFSRHMREIVANSAYWGRIKGYVMFAFTSKYALALYEALCLRANRRNNYEELSVEDFRQLIGVEPGKLKEFKNLKLRALSPAVLEINALSDFNVEITPLRDGGLERGKLKGFSLQWSKKTPKEWRAVMDELDRSKVGRKARISGTVEEIQPTVDRIPGDIAGPINERRAALRAKQTS